MGQPGKGLIQDHCLIASRQSNNQHQDMLLADGQIPHQHICARVKTEGSYHLQRESFVDGAEADKERDVLANGDVI